MTRPRLPDDDNAVLLDEVRRLRRDLDDLRLHPLVLPVYATPDSPDDEQRVTGAPWIDVERRAICWQIGQSVYCTDGAFIDVGGSDPDEGATGGDLLPLTYRGELEPITGTLRLYNDSNDDWRIIAARISVAVAPTGSPITADIEHNGASIFTAGGISIAAGSLTSGRVGVGALTAQRIVPPGEYLNIDIDSVGSTFPGDTLIAQLTTR